MALKWISGDATVGGGEIVEWGDSFGDGDGAAAFVIDGLGAERNGAE